MKRPYHEAGDRGTAPPSENDRPSTLRFWETEAARLIHSLIGSTPRTSARVLGTEHAGSGGERTPGPSRPTAAIQCGLTVSQGASAQALRSDLARRARRVRDRPLARPIARNQGRALVALERPDIPARRQLENDRRATKSTARLIVRRGDASDPWRVCRASSDSRFDACDKLASVSRAIS